MRGEGVRVWALRGCACGVSSQLQHWVRVPIHVCSNGGVDDDPSRCCHLGPDWQDSLLGAQVRTARHVCTCPMRQQGAQHRTWCDSLVPTTLNVADVMKLVGSLLLATATCAWGHKEWR